MESVGVAVVGCGYWGPNLVRNFARVDGARVRAVCDSDENLALEAMQFAPGATAYTTLDDVLADPAVDAIAIATPVSTHYDLTNRALDARKHVLVEKPLTTSSKEADALVEKAGRLSLILMAGHTFLYSPPVQKIRELLAEKTIGEVLTIDSNRVNLGIFRGDVDVIWDLAPHDISILMYLLSATPTEVAAGGASYMREGVADSAYLDLRFPSGEMAHVFVSWLSPVKMRRMNIVGSSGMILYDDGAEVEKVKIYSGDSSPVMRSDFHESDAQLYRIGDILVPTLPRTEPLRNEAHEFVRCVASGKQPLSNGEFGADVVRVLECASESATRLGIRVPVG